MTALPDKSKSGISAMFNSIAKNYDFLNHLLSLGIDKKWRKILIRHIMKREPKTALDIACGTGDISIALWKKGLKVSAIDIAEKMIDVAREKSGKIGAKIKFICASADSVPFEDCSFDLVTIGFGIRNFDIRGESLLEIRRVLKQGGELAILEFATPKNRLWRWIFKSYFTKVVPIIGGIISKKRYAYSYLPVSVDSFPQYEEFASELEHFGFKDVQFITLSGGVAILYTGKKID
ncbi:MAG: bifunctional demethylmenaquinone methyltransferase/2-methoxy-6-polyprenyl-1,4-benzoquinol methylase UbiE [Bacteroidales bacterium]|nr:bifunctional demethylmenaquinone methyltransferase/2-methoxy-6-polyprenyl-1,4-benzoquinol methylase UbiE [Bacteroidales bacterium]